MIATILPSSPTFHAVAYNEKKVAQGKATLMEMKNFGELNLVGYSDDSDLQKYLIEYSSNNSRITQPQFHLAISCKGNEYSAKELLEFGHLYLKEMGYGDPDQPLLVYEHHDTDNTHIHIVTSRVDPKGRKINDSHERRRSQKVLEKLTRQNMQSKAEADLKVAKQFDFRSESQFKAVMQAMGYECYTREQDYIIKKGGMVQTKIAKEEIARCCENNKLNHYSNFKENARWRQIFKKYRDINSDRSGLEQDLKKLFGISIICFGKKDTPYGYVAVDFKNKKVLEGSRILGITDLFDFKTAEEHLAEIEEYVNVNFDDNPFITTFDLNKKLRRFGAYIKKDKVRFGNHEILLSGMQRALLERNNKIAWRNGFEVQSKTERDLLCRLTGFDIPELISYKKEGKYYCKDYTEISAIFNNETTSEIVSELEAAGFKFIAKDNSHYLYRMESQTLVDLNKAGFNSSKIEAVAAVYYGVKPNSDEQKTQKTHPGSSIPAEEHSRSDNREWEVGKRGSDPDDMDMRNGISY